MSPRRNGAVWRWPKVAIAFKSSNKGTLSSSPTTYTLPSTTATNDCIVVCMNMAGTAAVTVTGAGATWVEAVNENPVGPECIIWVGYAATSGNTTITITFAGAEGAVVVGMFTGVQSSPSPVVAAAGNSSTPSTVNTLTTTSESYSSGQLVIAACATTVTSNWSTTTWTSQATNSLGKQIDASTRACAADYFIAASSTSNAAVYSWIGAANVAEAGIVVLAAAIAANQGNMLAVMGP